MKLFKTVDEKLSDIGFAKMNGVDSENEYGVSYRRFNTKYNYMQRLDIVHKASGRHLIMSYDEDHPKHDLTSNYVVGLTYEEILLAIRKYRELKRKYKWE